MSDASTKNPNWSQEETILALELYLELERTVPSVSHPEVVALSSLLRSNPVYSDAIKTPSFRNAASVAFKISNIHSAAGGHGFENNSKLDRSLWSRLGQHPTKVRSLAQAIRLAFEEKPVPPITVEGSEPEFLEGRLITRLHRRKERDPKLRKRVLADRRSNDRLRCDCCEVGSSPILGDLGFAMFEVHHIDPLGWSGRRRTKLSDLAFLCANCHRLLHALMADRGEWVGVAALRAELGFASTANG